MYSLKDPLDVTWQGFVEKNGRIQLDIVKKSLLMPSSRRPKNDSKMQFPELQEAINNSRICSAEMRYTASSQVLETNWRSSEHRIENCAEWKSLMMWYLLIFPGLNYPTSSHLCKWLLPWNQCSPPYTKRATTQEQKKKWCSIARCTHGSSNAVVFVDGNTFCSSLIQLSL